MHGVAGEGELHFLGLGLGLGARDGEPDGALDRLRHGDRVPDLGADRRSASGRMRRSVFASRETFWRVRGGETWTSSRYDFLRVRHHNTEPDDRLSRKKRFVSCTACVFLYASRRSNAMIPYPFQRRIVDIASDQGIQTEGLCPRRAVSISRVSVSL